MNISDPDEIVIAVFDLDPIFGFRSPPTATLAQVPKFRLDFPNVGLFHLAVTSLFCYNLLEQYSIGEPLI